MKISCLEKLKTLKVVLSLTAHFKLLTSRDFFLFFSVGFRDYLSENGLKFVDCGFSTAPGSHFARELTWGDVLDNGWFVKIN